MCPKTAQGAPKRPQRSPKERQKERNAVPRACLGTPKCVQRSPRYPKTLDQLHQRPLCVLLVLLPFGLLLLSLVLIPSPLHYYPYYYTTTGGGDGGWFVPPAPRSGAPAPEHAYYCVTITTSINIILSVLVGVLVLHVNNVSYVCVTYVWFRFGSRHFRLLYMFMSAHTDKMRDPCRGFWRRPTPIVSFDRTHPCPEYCNWFSPGGNSPKHVWRLLAFYFSMFLGGVVV